MGYANDNARDDERSRFYRGIIEFAARHPGSAETPGPARTRAQEESARAGWASIVREVRSLGFNPPAAGGTV